ncbi:hypothetical protein H0X32_02925 [Patescibacteria group bacterium]|nr:hypothetical protein [Patescibacteria group bacterium]
MSYVVLYLLIILAFFISGLFIWGAWQLGRAQNRTRVLENFKKNPFTLTRHAGNPLMHPGKYEFEQQAVMNAAAAHDGERTHLFYRAIGSDGVSRIGYASSKDGIQLEERLPYPVFALEGSDPHLDALRRAHAEKNYPGLVASGGSWGGTEDPRAMIMDDHLYLSFSAFENWNSVRIGVTSLAVADLKQKRWNWSPLAFLSPQNQVNKNWVLFPEKINGKFALLHSVSPTVEIAYRDDLNAIGSTESYIESPQGPRTRGRSGHWDNWIRGVGPAPMKTEKGWLVLYHATDREKYSHEYQLGAMLLDVDDPTKVLARSPAPILSPAAVYETSGLKPGVVYSCGATIQDDNLTVYYGAADNYVCAARTSLSGFLKKLLGHDPNPFSPFSTPLSL